VKHQEIREGRRTREEEKRQTKRMDVAVEALCGRQKEAFEGKCSLQKEVEQW
jgi:hypothetical protein